MWPLPRAAAFGPAALAHDAGSFVARAAALVLALASPACTSLPGAGAERIVEVSTGRHITRAELLSAARASDYVLLGEFHDNALHHVRRGELLAELGAPGGRTAVVAEHLPRGQRVNFTDDLLPSLAAAGFDAKGWRWPLHEALFAGVARAGARLAGANAPREQVRQVAREGGSAVPPELKAVLDAAPLGPAAQAALDADLVRGHCGQLGGARLGNMRWAQRTRDASMWLALRDAPGNGTGPAVLVAGNGHVRSDYGVAQLAARLQPRSRILSVAFVEPGTTSTGAPYTHLWFTAAALRDDPCARAGGVLLPPAAPAR